MHDFSAEGRVGFGAAANLVVCLSEYVNRTAALTLESIPVNAKRLPTRLLRHMWVGSKFASKQRKGGGARYKGFFFLLDQIVSLRW